jgi:hypothetical protein
LESLDVTDEILQQKDKDPELNLWVKQCIISTFMNNPIQNGMERLIGPLDQASTLIQKEDEERLLAQKRFYIMFLRGDFKSDKDTLIIVKDQHIYKLRYDPSTIGEKKGRLNVAKRYPGRSVFVIPSIGYWISYFYAVHGRSNEKFPSRDLSIGVLSHMIKSSYKVIAV